MRSQNFHYVAVVCFFVFAASTGAAAEPPQATPEQGWHDLFDGRSLDGWKVAGVAESFSVDDGMIVVHGKPLARLFYDGEVAGHQFKDVDFRAEVMTKPGANGGIYFHTQYIQRNYPKNGYEVQINNTAKDPVKTGSLYHVRNVTKAPAEDNRWFIVELSVRGKDVTVKVDGRTLVEYTEPDKPSQGNPYFNRRLSRGAFALQAHDPKSVVYFRRIMVRPIDASRSQ